MPSLILEGGTLRPIFSAGVMDALLDNNITFPYCIGVSAGITNGVSYISKQKGRNLEVVTKYRNDNRYLSYRNFLRCKSIFGLDFVFDEILKKYNLPTPYDGHMQYARIFTSPKFFNSFFHDFEDQIMNHKLWLDTKVKEHLVFMQLYFNIFNTIPLMIKRIPLPKGKELTDVEFKKIHRNLLFIIRTLL